MKSFSSFREIFCSMPLPQAWLPNHQKYWAHLPGAVAQKPETLQEHIELVNHYALQIIEAHNLDDVVNTTIEDIMTKHELDEQAGSYIKEIFASAIHFHDYGKVNPNFQVQRMNNCTHFTPDKELSIGSEHSRLSTFIFLHHHIKQIQQKGFDDDTKTILYVIVFLLSNAITRHHASTIENKINLDTTHIQSLRQFLPLFALDDIHEDVSQYIEKWQALFNHFYEVLKPSTCNCFSEVALLKICFSILTAADFCATFEYMNQMSISDWGIISNTDKKCYTKAFYSNKSYNRELCQKIDFYNTLPFDALQSKSSENLNILRQKLAAEAISKLRANSTSHLFYLEAPTGGGKTNLSLALALELLNLDDKLNKVIYVFPFTTLATQTFRTIAETLQLGSHEIVELHSKAGFNEKENTIHSEEKDAFYGNKRKNYIANLFANYPFTLMTHIRFFDILKSNRKEVNYLLHRMANSVVIIDELQAYSPSHWDKTVFLLSEYARLFNMRVILMSATLPYIDSLLPPSSPMRGKAVRLISNRNAFFNNPNFGQRVQFSTELLQYSKPKSIDERAAYLKFLKEQVLEKSEEYARKNNNCSRTIIEFIKKKTANEFYRLIKEDAKKSGYETFLISGEILEPRRRQVIHLLKKNTQISKVILVSTQVIEAGVDIDMDTGFKDISIPDSEEQLAGRVNRNALKEGNWVYLFDLDSKEAVYGKDLRYKTLARDPEGGQKRISILNTKNFSSFYQSVIKQLQKNNQDPFRAGTLQDYMNHFCQFKFDDIHKNFHLIEQSSISVFVPLNIPIETLSTEEKKLLEAFHISTQDNCVSGKDVWHIYESIVEHNTNIQDFMDNKIALKQLSSLMALFTFSFFTKSSNHNLVTYGKDQLGFFYLENWTNIYSFEEGIDLQTIETDFIL